VSGAQKRKRGARRRTALSAYGARLDVGRTEHNRRALAALLRYGVDNASGGLDLGPRDWLSANGMQHA
jgi:hypothetical protein